MYSKQEAYESQLEKMGLLSDKSFTCTCYMNEVGNLPKKGDILSWAESSAVVYANSVLGARCNRNSGIIEMMGCILGKVPYFGLLTDEGRKANWIIELRTDKLPEAQVLGSAIGMKVMEEVPYIKNLGKYFGNNLDQQAKDYLKDMGAATASNGAVGLFHVEGLTPEAKEMGEQLINDNPKVYIIDEQELERIKTNYPVMWENKDTKPKMCFIGCPHLSLEQLIKWTELIESNLKEKNHNKVLIQTILTSSPSVLEKFFALPEAKKLESMGVKTSYICPLMYSEQPSLCENASNNKLQ